MQTFRHRAAILEKDAEGSTCLAYAPATAFQAEMWAAGGKLQAEMYGNRLPLIRSLRVDGNYQEIREKSGKVKYQIDSGAEITVNDGICIFSDDPDYKVIAIYPYSHLILEVEKL